MVLWEYIIRKSVPASKSGKVFEEAVIEAVSFCRNHVTILIF